MVYQSILENEKSVILAGAVVSIQISTVTYHVLVFNRVSLSKNFNL